MKASTNGDIKRAPDRDVASDTEKEREGSKRERDLQRDDRTKMHRGCDEASERERKSCCETESRKQSSRRTPTEQESHNVQQSARSMHRDAWLSREDTGTRTVLAKTLQDRTHAAAEKSTALREKALPKLSLRKRMHAKACAQSPRAIAREDGCTREHECEQNTQLLKSQQSRRWRDGADVARMLTK